MSLDIVPATLFNIILIKGSVLFTASTWFVLILGVIKLPVCPLGSVTILNLTLYDVGKLPPLKALWFKDHEGKKLFNCLIVKLYEKVSPSINWKVLHPIGKL